LPPDGFKALICCVSAPSAAEAEKQRQQLLAEVEKASTLNDTLRNFTGFGSVLRAAEHHRGSLEDCWLIASEDSRPYFEPLKSAFRKFFPDVLLHAPVTVKDVYAKIDDVYQKTHMVFDRCEADTDGRIKPRDIITDVTGGTKIMSIAVAMACLDAERHLQYIEQKTRKDFYEIDITWEKVITGRGVKSSNSAG
jgi:hypothetical protein